MLVRALFFLLITAYIQISIADESDFAEFDIDLGSDNTITITRFGDEGNRILWIPSEHGIHDERHYDLLESLSSLKFEVWLTHLHESYFVPPGRSSYTQVPIADIAETIEKSLPVDGRKLFIVSTGRGATLSLLALNHWINRTGGSDRFGGIILLHPNLQANTPAPGTPLEYLPVVDTTQLPVFIIQPKMSNKFWYLQDLVARLSDGGSVVYSQVIENAGDGYHVRHGANRTEKSLTEQLPGHISKATRLLAKTRVETTKTRHEHPPWEVSSLSETLQPYPDEADAPALELKEVGGEQYKLADYRGKVVLLNFWATWCPPCVEEIPSLGRLQNVFSNEDLVVLSVDIGENKQDIETFLQKVPADFPVLLDPDGSSVKRWKVVAFPTTFVIDRQGKIRLAYYGALQWDSAAVVEQLKTIVMEKPSQ